MFLFIKPKLRYGLKYLNFVSPSNVVLTIHIFDLQNLIFLNTIILYFLNKNHNFILILDSLLKLLIL